MPDSRPTLALRVGVTGHRPNKLAGVDTDRLRNQVDKVLGWIRAITQRCQDTSNAEGSKGAYQHAAKPSLRLVTNLAEGSDMLVSELALARGYELNLVLPFKRERYEADFSPKNIEDFRGFLEHPCVTSTLELDGASPQETSEAYRTAGHFMLEHADILIALWDGQEAAGAGGTADIVAEAQRLGMGVVWVALDGTVRCWRVFDGSIDPLADGNWELIAPVVEADGLPEPFACQVRRLVEPPADVSARKCLDAFAAEFPRGHSYAGGFQLLERLTLGRAPKIRVDYARNHKRTSAWRETLEAAEVIGGKIFADRLKDRLKERWLRADVLAVHYAHRFRTAFVTNFALAALAVLVGLVAVFAWDSLTVKAVLVAVELCLIAVILFQTRQGVRARWQERWLDYRNLAEVLRLSRLFLLMGSSPIRPGSSVGLTPGQTWVVWYLHAVLRDLPPPSGVIDEKTLQHVVEIAIREEIDAQIDYHQQTEARLKRLDHRLERAGELFLWGTIVAGLTYLLAYAGSLAVSVATLAKAIKPWATLMGGTLPVMGAASFAIRATGDFRTAARESERMVATLRGIRPKLEAELSAPQRDRVRYLVAEMMRIMSDDLRVWGVIYSERTLTPAF